MALQRILQDECQLVVDAVHGDVQLPQSLDMAQLLQKERYRRVKALQLPSGLGDAQALDPVVVAEPLPEAEELLGAEAVPADVHPLQLAHTQGSYAVFGPGGEAQPNVGQIRVLQVGVLLDRFAQGPLVLPRDLHGADVQVAQAIHDVQHLHHGLLHAQRRPHALPEQQPPQRLPRPAAHKAAQERHERAVRERLAVGEVHLFELR
mmetsp:Transcript_87559/g.256013  ORF Transcript_87559/g.256013 Transcript_87559/m.256013 type:complete len:206 (-) Transcript_87559:12-629(-)